MPRAILAQSAHADRSRTMSSVSDELGVSPSTLRTWERRYGLGPAQRETGERRRYQTEDVDRLRAMMHHVRAGMSAAEAAKRALAESTLLPRRGPANAAQLRSVALSDDYQRLEEVIEVAVASHGLVPRTYWSLCENSAATHHCAARRTAGQCDDEQGPGRVRRPPGPRRRWASTQVSRPTRRCRQRRRCVR